MKKFWKKSDNSEYSEQVKKALREMHETELSVTFQHKKTQHLTKDDKIFLKRIGIMNGCGGRNRGFFQKILLKFLTPVFFEASCDLHDFGYWKGGDEARRKECDEKFLQKILWDIYFLYDVRREFENSKRKSRKILYYFWAVRNFFKKNFYKFLAKIFYIAVRIGGDKYFNYK